MSIIKNVTNDELCSLCGHRDKYLPENAPVVKIAGNQNCYLCGNEINFCKKHWGILKIEIVEEIKIKIIDSLDQISYKRVLIDGVPQFKYKPNHPIVSEVIAFIKDFDIEADNDKKD